MVLNNAGPPVNTLKLDLSIDWDPLSSWNNLRFCQFSHGKGKTMRNQSFKNLFNCFAISLSLAFVGCSKDDKPKPKEFSPFGILSEGLSQPTLKVMNELGEPLANAQVLIGAADGAFPGNFGVTDQNGEFLVPADWTTTDMVTVDAPGYVRATYIGLNPESKIFTLKKKFIAQVQLGGVTSGHPIRNKDGLIDFTLVMSAMTRQDLLNFQIQKVISPLNDKLTIVGQEIELPANVSLPKQSENYFIGLTIEKPAYRLFFGDQGVQRVFAARGRFPFKTVVDGLRGDQEIFELINYFSITGGSIRDVNLTSEKNKLDIPVMDITFSQKKPFKAPKLEKSQVMVAVTVADNGGFLIPTDVKRLTSEQAVNLAVWGENPAFIAQVIKNKTEFDPAKPGIDRLSAILLPFDEKVTSEYLPLITNPATKANNVFVVPQVESSLNKLATYGLISDVKVEKGTDGILKKTPTAVWEVYAPSWVTEIQLPDWKWSKTAPATRFEVSLVGSTSSDTIPLGPQMMEKATHVTRSSVDY